MENIEYIEANSKLYVVTIKIETINEKGKVKNVKENYIVNGSNTSEATNFIKEFMKGTLADWKISSIKETNYIGMIDKK